MKATVALFALVAYCTAGIYFQGQCSGCRNGYAGKCKDNNPDVDDEVACRGTSGGHDIEVYCTNGNGGVTTVAGIDGERYVQYGFTAGVWYIDEDAQCAAMKAIDCSSGGADDATETTVPPTIEVDDETTEPPTTQPPTTPPTTQPPTTQAPTTQPPTTQPPTTQPPTTQPPTTQAPTQEAETEDEPSICEGCGETSEIDASEFEDMYKTCKSKAIDKMMQKFTEEFGKDVPECVTATTDGQTVVVSCGCACCEPQTIQCEEMEVRNGKMKWRFNVADFFRAVNGFCGCECGSC